jgi:hypothetical protein
MIKLKKLFNSTTIIHAMEFTLFALLLTEAYLSYKDEIDKSIERLKKTLNSKGEKADGE